MLVILKSKKQKFHQHKRPISTKSIGNNKIIVSIKVSFDKRVLNILFSTKMLKKLTLTYVYPKMRAYRKHFDETKYISFLIKSDELLEKYNDIWEKLKIASKENLIVNLYIMQNI